MDIFSSLYRISVYGWIIVGLYFLFFIIQLFYYLYLFRKPYQHATKGDESDDDSTNSEKKLPGISIIITAKDEAENLRKNLPSILNQDYSNYEVVVVDNGSTDSTSDVLNGFKQSYPNLYTTYIPVESEKVNSKKLALTIGIKAAKHDILLFTEPDTKPFTRKWVYEYSRAFSKDKDIVLGACQIEKDKSFSNKFILFDNLFFGVKYLSFALINKPYMGVGRNMAFRKKLFFDNKGFSSILNIEDGEDNVFINKIVTKENTAVIISEESMTVSNVINRFSTWRSAKTKYLTTQKYLTSNATSILAFEEFSRYSFYSLFIILSVIGVLSSVYSLLFFAILLFLIRYSVQSIIINKNSKLYNAGRFYFTLPLFDLLAPFVNHMFLNYEAKRDRK